MGKTDTGRHTHTPTHLQKMDSNQFVVHFCFEHSGNCHTRCCVSSFHAIYSPQSELRGKKVKMNRQRKKNLVIKASKQANQSNEATNAFAIRRFSFFQCIGCCFICDQQLCLVIHDGDVKCTHTHTQHFLNIISIGV